MNHRELGGGYWENMGMGWGYHACLISRDFSWGNQFRIYYVVDPGFINTQFTNRGCQVWSLFITNLEVTLSIGRVSESGVDTSKITLRMHQNWGMNPIQAGPSHGSGPEWHVTRSVSPCATSAHLTVPGVELRDQLQFPGGTTGTTVGWQKGTQLQIRQIKAGSRIVIQDFYSWYESHLVQQLFSLSATIISLPPFEIPSPSPLILRCVKGKRGPTTCHRPKRRFRLEELRRVYSQ